MDVRTALQVSQRRTLADDVMTLLKADSHVHTGRFYGSLEHGEGDVYSDIDVEVHLSGVTDRAFAETVPSLLRPLGHVLVAGWGLGALPETYVRTLFFEDVPLFWHVDIACKSPHHIDGSDILRVYHPEQIFKIWLDVVSNFLRGKDTSDYLERFMSQWADLSGFEAQPTKVKLSHYLDMCAVRARARNALNEIFYKRCDEIRCVYLEN